MASNRNHQSSRSSRKEEKKHARPATTNGTNPTDTTGNDTSPQHSSNMHSFHNEHLSTTSQAPSQQEASIQQQAPSQQQVSSQEQASSQHQGEYQYIDRPWEQGTPNTDHTIDTSYASPMERWYNANANDQPWHGISAVHVDVQNTGTGMDWSECEGGEKERSGMDSMDGERSTEGRWIG